MRHGPPIQSGDAEDFVLIRVVGEGVPLGDGESRRELRDGEVGTDDRVGVGVVDLIRSDLRVDPASDGALGGFGVDGLPAAVRPGLGQSGDREGAIEQAEERAAREPVASISVRSMA